MWYTFLFPPKIASNLDPLPSDFCGGGDVVGGVTLDALGGVGVTALGGEAPRPPVGDSMVGEVILIGVTFKDDASPAFFSCWSIMLKCRSIARACSKALALGSTIGDGSPFTGVISTLPKVRLFPLSLKTS